MWFGLSFLTESNELNSTWSSHLNRDQKKKKKGKSEKREKANRETKFSWVGWVGEKYQWSSFLQHEACFFYCLPTTDMEWLRKSFNALEIENNDMVHCYFYDYRKDLESVVSKDKEFLKKRIQREYVFNNSTATKNTEHLWRWSETVLEHGRLVVLRWLKVLSMNEYEWVFIVIENLNRCCHTYRFWIRSQYLICICIPPHFSSTANFLMTNTYLFRSFADGSCLYNALSAKYH